MGFPEDALQPFLDCMAPAPYPWTGIGGPGGLPNHGIAAFSSMLAGITWILDFIPPPPLPSPPTPTIFIDPFLGALNIPGDLGELDFSLVIPGGPTIPATGTDIRYNQGGHISLILVSVAVPFGIISLMVDKLLEIPPVIEIPGIPDIIALLDAAAISAGLSGDAVVNFSNCFATAIFNMLTALIPV
jgi:hypothetical protein